MESARQARLKELVEHDPFAETGPGEQGGMVETERDRLIRLVSLKA